ncbi:type III-B CRISPR-associated protein Cas10/Cmr2 [Vibrio spartinae]|uniref:CRISPR-associated protein n=1 Tax=Vibrio spartinae TaxID=1918945 RepID=A0A1N6MAN4_9VIBR|nr:type III-B CRISPR-associated protein Cas10/Cmr2 [Vibrio spartinae]SIO96525.1 CRISPR-associated protein [Vibrio spartinae]
MDYLVAISIGPVQSLIEAGRRSQDLWCGSWLLSEVSRAVAEFLKVHPAATLIFPVLDEVDLKHKYEANIANVVRAEVKGVSKEDLSELVENAKKAANQCVQKIFDDTLQSLDFSLNQTRWQAQQDDVLEVFAAWVVFTEPDYQTASKRLGQLLQARKQTRNFAPIKDNEDGWFKSSLDGANNTVLHQTRWQKLDPKSDEKLIQALGLTKDEDLDALGVVKRKAGDSEQFTPFSRIVAHSWIQHLSSEALQELKQLYQPLQKLGKVTKVTGNDACYAAFPYDGEYLFSSRLERSDIDQETQKPLLKFLAEQGEPVSYGVLLKADGDHMGDLLKEAKTPGQSRDISRCLHGFATQVRSTVRQHGGHAIYTGGDDVLAFLPLATAFECAQTLAQDFKQCMGQLAEQLNVACPTLSVGLAIGHFVQPMRQLRHRAIAAEKLAKGNEQAKPRNALAIQLGIRSGHEIAWRCRWDDKATLTALSTLSDAFAEGQLPSRIMQEVRAMAQRLAWAKDHHGIQQSEFERMLDRAMEQGGETKISSDTKALLRQLSHKHSLSELANLLIIARWLSAKTHSDIRGND